MYVCMYGCVCVYLCVIQGSAEEDPYRMTLHKLYMKMCESSGDWRTVVKAGYVLHVIVKYADLDACEKFGTSFR